jgi:hypothetical protein
MSSQVNYKEREFYPDETHCHNYQQKKTNVIVLVTTMILSIETDLITYK